MYEIQEHSKITSIFDTNFKSELDAQIALRKKESWESSQAMLASLMAAEKLRVVFDANLKAPAHIDLKRRIIRIARLVSGQQHLIRGLMVHEVGHARFTKGNEPIDHVLNIVEDGYIERMISKKYPGGKKHLKVVFDHFFSDVFAKKYCGAKVNLVTRTLNIMNYNCKGIKFGKRIPYPKELPADMIKFFEQEVEMCVLPTLTEREAIAKKIKKLLKEFREPKEDFNSLPNLGDHRGKQDHSEDDGDGYGDNGIDWNDEPEKEPEIPKELDASEEVDEEDDDDAEESKKASKAGGENEDKDKSEEDKDKSEKEDGDEGEKTEGETSGEKTKTSGEEDEDEDEDEDEGPINTSGNPGGAGDADDDTNEKEIEEWWKSNVLENKDELFDHHDGFETEGQADNHITSLEIASPSSVFDLAKKKDITSIPSLKDLLYQEDLTRAERAYATDLEEAKYTARAMFQKFLLEKNASESRRISHQTTGSLDIARLAQYRINNNIFKTRRILPEGVSHGAVMVLDWSGSMNSKIKDLWFRAAEFVEFANLSGVEVVVWAFTMSSGGIDPTMLEKNPDMLINHGQYFRIIDTVNHSRLENIERLRRFWTLIQLKTGMNHGWRSNLRGRGRYIQNEFGMGGTNIVEAHAFAHYLAKGMKTDKKNVLVVSDGSDHSGWTGSTIGSEGAFNPDDPDTPLSLSDSARKIRACLDGVSLSERSKKGLKHTWNSRDEALWRQTEKFSQEGVNTTGIYIGLPSQGKSASLRAAYNDRFVVWPNWNGKGGQRQRVKDNAFIGQLVKMISA